MVALRDDRRTVRRGADGLSCGPLRTWPDTAKMLAELGFLCDTSVRSGFDYRAGHGPDYRNARLEPWWVDTAAGAVLEVPVTRLWRLLGARAAACITISPATARGRAQRGQGSVSSNGSR